jgi:hypothetical protein
MLFLDEFDRVEDHQELYSPGETDKTLYGAEILSHPRIARVCVSHSDRAQRHAPKRGFVRISLCSFEFRLGAGIIGKSTIAITLCRLLTSIWAPE